MQTLTLWCVVGDHSWWSAGESQWLYYGTIESSISCIGHSYRPWLCCVCMFLWRFMKWAMSFVGTVQGCHFICGVRRALNVRMIT